MLKYLILVAENTTVMVIIIGMLYAYVSRVFGRQREKLLTVGVIAGFLGAATMAVLKNTTKIIDRSGGTGMWNVRTFTLSTVALILFYVVGAKWVREKLPGKGTFLVPILASALAFTIVFYTLPDILAYPYTFSLSGDSLFSTAFLYRLIGYILGLGLAAVTCIAANRTSKQAELRTLRGLLYTILLINGFQQITKAIQVLHAKRIITARALFVLVRHTSNHSNLFIYAVMLLAFVIPLGLWTKSFRVREPYENPAQHRKIRAKWRSTRRWSTVLSLCFILVVLSMTLFTALDNQEVELSPAEECEIREDGVYISLTQVDDGALHRFNYRTESGVDVRFIIIKKPNSSAYGIGLDACDICGETGYYERNGQVICKLCDVVMNINTIGFKGGCNPIPIDYSVSDGYITITAETLIEHEKIFK